MSGYVQLCTMQKGQRPRANRVSSRDSHYTVKTDRWIAYSNLTNAVRQAGVGSAAEVLISDPKVAGVLPRKGVQTVSSKPKKARPRFKAAFADANLKAVPNVIYTKIKKSKSKPLLPILKWNELRTNLSLSEAEARIQIREFALRFAPVMGTVIAKTHLEELEDIGGRGRDSGDEDEITPWVSEACVKSIVLGLLGLLANDEEGDLEKVYMSPPT
jgi:hypothetical protein